LACSCPASFEIRLLVDKGNRGILEGLGYKKII
jgi:hypothetical protein